MDPRGCDHELPFPLQSSWLLYWECYTMRMLSCTYKRVSASLGIGSHELPTHDSEIEIHCWIFIFKTHYMLCHFMTDVSDSAWGVSQVLRRISFSLVIRSIQGYEDVRLYRRLALSLQISSLTPGGHRLSTVYSEHIKRRDSSSKYH